MKALTTSTKRITLPTVLIALSIGAGLLTWQAHADSITLTTGEIISGTIVSETATNLEIELSKYKGVSRVFEKSQIKPGSVQKIQGVSNKTSNNFSANAQAAPRQENRAPFAFSGNAFDFVIWLSKTRNALLSVDPNIVGELAKSEVQIAEATTAPTSEVLETQLKPIGLILRTVALTPNLKVSFITSPPAWAYYNAISCSKTGDFQSAVALLVNADNSEFGDHCTGFKTVLEKILNRNRELFQMESHVRQAIEKYKNTIASADSSVTMGGLVGMDGKSSSPQLHQARAAQLRKDAEVDFAKVWQTIDKAYEKLVLDNGPLALRFRETEMANLAAEANFILNNLVGSRGRFQNLVDQARDVTKTSTSHEFDKMTSDIGDMRSEYTRTLNSVEGAIRSAIGILPVNSERAGHTFSEAYSIDRSSLLACVGCGYCKVLNQIKGLDTLAERTNIVGTSLMQSYEREFRNQQKNNLLQVLGALNHPTINPTVTSKSGKIGTAEGLAVRLGEGSLFGISVTIGPLVHRATVASDVKQTYWSKLTEQLTDEPIEFGDYGTKDSYLIVSAIQAYKWIKSVDAISEMEKKKNGLKIEFHQLFGGKGGDSAGVTFAVSAFSALQQVAIRQEVAMTGSIRADGSVKAVGGVPEKISGACHESGIETIIVPYENRRDLVAVPADQLCRAAIITANDIRDYLRHATLTMTNETVTEKFEAQTALTRLRIAQTLLLLGDRTVARGLLESLMREHPEIYNAGRLLELINKLDSPNFTQVAQIISMQDAERIVRQLNPISLETPGAVTAVPSANSISLSWTRSSGATEYVVQRDGESEVYVVTEPVFVDRGLSPNIQYCYSVVASNKLGSSTASPQKCATISRPSSPPQASDAPSSPPQASDAPSWWKQYWYVIAGGVLILGYFAFRPSKDE